MRRFLVRSPRLLGGWWVVAGLTVALCAAPVTAVASPVAATGGTGTGRGSVAAPPVAGGFVPVVAARVVDSRVGLQVRGPVPGFGVVGVRVAGHGGVPAGVGAVVVTVTAVGPEVSGHLRVWPAGTARPATSALNFSAGQDISSTLVVPVGAGGRIEVFNGSPGRVDLLVDVTGYTRAGTPTAAGAFVPVVAARVVDSRVSLQVRGPVPGFGVVGMRVTGRGGVPARVGAVVVTVTAVGPEVSGHLRVWPTGTARPATSALNFSAGQDISTTLVVPVGAGGRIEAFNGSPGRVHLLVDVTGYTLAGSAAAAGAFVPVVAARVVDSRVGVQVRGPVPGFGVVAVQVAGRGGVPARVGAVVVTVTAVGPGASGHLRVWPAGTARPATSVLNFSAGRDISTTLVVPVGAGGRIEVFNGSPGRVDLLVDVTGYVIGSPSVPGFAHPGILVGNAQLEFVKARITAGAQPWTSALAKAMRARADTGRNKGVAYSSPSWTPRPRAYVGCGPYWHPDEGCADELNDSIAAYTKALLWYHTGDSGYARDAVAIMNAWSAALVDHRFDSTHTNGHLQAAWVGEILPRAAEIIRYTYTPGRGQPALDVQRFAGMLHRAFLPHVINGWYGGGANWLLSMAEATMNIGIFTDDYATFDAGVAAWRAQVPAAVYLAGDANPIPALAGMPISPPHTMYAAASTSRASFSRYWYTPTRFVSGLEGESCRDINHMAMGLGAMINGAETARLQGIDLYGEARQRIVSALELNAGFVHDAVTGRRNPPANWVCPNPVNTTNGAWKVTWEIGYNHYANRMGLSLPNTGRLLQDVVRPSAWRSSGHMDYETLTHAGAP